MSYPARDAISEMQVSLVRLKASRLAIQHSDDLMAVEAGIDGLFSTLSEVQRDVDMALRQLEKVSKA